MRAVLSWLREYVEIRESPKDLAHALTMAGIAVDAVEQHDGETVFDLDITSNRPDAMNHFGIAREIAAIYGRKLRAPKIELTESAAPADAAASVEIVHSGLCPRYVGRVLKNIAIAPSPDWMRRRLELCGVRSINNIADLTNYVLLEIGQPTHAFDLDKLAENRIVVPPRPGGREAGHARRRRTGALARPSGDLRRIRSRCAGGDHGRRGHGNRRGHHECPDRGGLVPTRGDPQQPRASSRCAPRRRIASNAARIGTPRPRAADRIAGLLDQVGGGEVLRGRIDCFPAPPVRPTIRLRRREHREASRHGPCRYRGHRHSRRLGIRSAARRRGLDDRRLPAGAWMSRVKST